MRAALAFFLLSVGFSVFDDRPHGPSLHGPTVVLMDFTRAGGFYSAPFPSEELRKPDGHLDLSGFPGRGKAAVIDAALGLLSSDARGFASTAGIFFAATAPLDPLTLPTATQSLTEAATVYLVDVDPASPLRGHRTPIDVTFLEDGGRFGAPNLLTLLPYQGVPLRPATLYAAVVTTRVHDDARRALTLAPSLRTLLAHGAPAGLSGRALAEFQTAFAVLKNPTELAAITVFRTDSPMAGMAAVRDAILDEHPTPNSPLAAAEVFASYCVYQSTIDLPQYQAGTPPYANGGGTWVFDSAGRAVRQRYDRANLVVTLPTTPMPAGGFPTVVFSRTGAGGERPLVDRGVHVDGQAIPGSGPALEFARAGFAAISIDGPLGGLRNPSHGDEQFLIFNPTNPGAIRDNLRQSAAELILTAHLLDGLTVDASHCAGLANPSVRFDTATLALFGHSMGATIAPLALAFEPRFKAAILSGAGGSWIANLIHKQKPLPVRHITEFMLGYTERWFTVTEGDPGLSLLQWAAESADPPVYGALVGGQVLMFQGIADHYILPPMANASSLSMGLDLAGAELDVASSELKAFAPFRDVAAFSGRAVVKYPVEGKVKTVVQHLGDGVEDGHEIVFQTASPKYQYRCFLSTYAKGRARVPAPDDSLSVCP